MNGSSSGGSSSIPAGGVSVQMSAKKLAENLKELAADALEASPRDLEFEDGSAFGGPEFPQVWPRA